MTRSRTQTRTARAALAVEVGEHRLATRGALRRARAVVAIGIFAAANAVDGSEAAALAARSLLLGAQAVGNTTFAVGAYGNILRSVDDGQTWTAAAVPLGVTLTAVAFADARHGWAVGHDAVILHTTDAGQTWAKQYQGPNLDAPLLSVLFLDAQTGFAVGAYGQYVSTTDGGATWTPRSIIADDRHFNRITVGPSGTLYIAGEQGTLLRSRDRGATWESIATPYDGSFYGVLPLGDTILLAYGLRSHIYRSENDGRDWREVPAAPPGLLAAAVRLRSGAIVLAGQARLFLVSRDAGRAFVAWSVPMTTPVAELVETAGGQLLALGEAGITPLPPP